ncbi:hypothetical protein [Achromobacter mucicolens]|uniref:hypothetical protein n=1 Tax=Achromobacter mucicolens TaxID=1389922 RepID=UPI0030B8468F
MRSVLASRYTVRAALQELQDMGLVSRRKNVGARVKARESKAMFKPTLSSVEDSVQFGEAHRRVVQSADQRGATQESAVSCAISVGQRPLGIRISHEALGVRQRP